MSAPLRICVLAIALALSPDVARGQEPASTDLGAVDADAGDALDADSSPRPSEVTLWSESLTYSGNVMVFLGWLVSFMPTGMMVDDSSPLGSAPDDMYPAVDWNGWWAAGILPIVGPWIQLALPTSPGNGMSIASGVTQALGLVLIVVGQCVGLLDDGDEASSEPSVSLSIGGGSSGGASDLGATVGVEGRF